MSSDSVVWAIKNGDLDALKDADIEKNVNAKIMNGRMPIHFAADYGQLEVLKFLVDQGADINLKDDHGITPLLAAIFEEHASCVKYLLSKGARKDFKAPDGSSYSECASTDAIKSLLKE
eukprot:gene18196-20012_t